METMMKTCHIRLNRNFMNSLGTIKINNPQDLERKNSEYSFRNKTLSFTTSTSKASDENNHRLRRTQTVKYLDEDRNSSTETSHSEFSEDGSSSNEEETNKEKVKKKSKRQLSKTDEPKKLNCLHCDKSFRSHSSYIIHSRSHLSKQFKCSLCCTNFKYRQSFISHMKNRHPEVEPFICDYQHCGQSFKTGKRLEIHNKMHLRYMCKFCKKLFARKYRMHKHVSKFH